MMASKFTGNAHADKQTHAGYAGKCAAGMKGGKMKEMKEEAREPKGEKY